jgi:hypothetical protein
MEGWKDGRLERWMVGEIEREGWKVGKMERWNIGKTENSNLAIYL